MNKRLVTALALLIAGGAIGNLLRFIEQRPNEQIELSAIPDQIGPYFGREQAIDSISLSVLRADNAVLKQYRNEHGNEYDLFVGYFGRQTFGSAIHSPKNCLPGSGWRIDAQQRLTIQLDDSMTREVNDLLIRFQSRRAVMLYWFETRLGATSNEYGLKLSLFRNALLFHPTDAAFIRITVEVGEGSIEEATRRGIAFAQAVYPFVRGVLPFNPAVGSGS